MEQGEETRHLIEAAGSLNGTIEDLRAMISREGFDIDRQYPPMGFTLIHHASRGDWSDVDDGRFALLLSHRPNLEIRAWPQSDWRSGPGWTALMFAVWSGTLDKVKLLLEAGAKVNTKDNMGFTPLILAQYSFDRDARNDVILSFGASKEAQDYRGKNAADHWRFWSSLDSQEENRERNLDGGFTFEGPMALRLV